MASESSTESERDPSTFDPSARGAVLPLLRDEAFEFGEDPGVFDFNTKLDETHAADVTKQLKRLFIYGGFARGRRLGRELDDISRSDSMSDSGTSSLEPNHRTPSAEQQNYLDKALRSANNIQKTIAQALERLHAESRHMEENLKALLVCLAKGSDSLKLVTEFFDEKDLDIFLNLYEPADAEAYVTTLAERWYCEKDTFGNLAWTESDRLEQVMHKLKKLPGGNRWGLRLCIDIRAGDHGRIEYHTPTEISRLIDSDAVLDSFIRGILRAERPLSDDWFLDIPYSYRLVRKIKDPRSVNTSGLQRDEAQNAKKMIKTIEHRYFDLFDELEARAWREIKVKVHILTKSRLPTELFDLILNWSMLAEGIGQVKTRAQSEQAPRVVGFDVDVDSESDDSEDV